MQRVITFIRLYPLHTVFVLVMLFIFAGIVTGIALVSQPEKKAGEQNPASAPTLIVRPTEEAPTDEPEPTEDIETQIKPTIAFTQQENTYKESFPQVFQGVDGSHAGGLVVTSQPDGVNIVIEATGVESDRGFSLSTTTPFKVEKVPVGTYTLSAAANGYTSVKKNFLITEDQITRIRVDMSPVTPTQ